MSHQYIDEIPPDAISPHEVVVDPSTSTAVNPSNLRNNNNTSTNVKESNTYQNDQAIKPLDTCIAIYDFPGTQPSHLPLNLGDTVHILSKADSGWWDGVILGTNGELLRGWVPHNYVRSVNYVQPVLKKLKNNKEIDSLTAANTAANVLIPSFNNILQKNLFSDSERNSPSNSVRKNSVVSFASSETSIRSDSRGSSLANHSALPSHTQSSTQLPSLSHHQQQQQQPLQHQQNSQSSQSTELQSPPPPVSNTSSFSVPHSNKAGSFSAFSSSLPASIMSTTPSTELNADITFVTISEAERLAADFKINNRKNLVWLPRITGAGDAIFYSEELNVYCEACPMAPYIPDVDNAEDGTIKIPSKEAINANPIISHDSEFTNDDHSATGGPHGAAAGTGATGADIRSQSSSGKSFDPLKRDSTSSFHSQSSGASSYHQFSQPFFAMPGLFYNHSSDITYWTELREKFNYLLDLSVKALRDHNKQLFSTHFTRLTKVISIVASASRLIQHDFMNTKYERSVRRKLKRIAGSYAQIYINGILHLSYMHYSQESSDAQLFSFDISKLNKSTNIPTDFRSAGSSVSTVHQDVSEPLGASNSNSTDNNATVTNDALNSMARNLNQIALNENNDYVTYLQQIESEVDTLRVNINALTKIFLKLTRDKKVRRSDYDGSDVSDDDAQDRYNILPQVYPRFITDEFNGGNWCNPFFTIRNPVLNASGDDLKNRYHSKVIIDREAYDSIKKSIDEMIKLSMETLELLDPAVQHKFYNESLKNDRNTSILRLIYKYLYHASATIDLIESFDFTVFCLIRRYLSNEGENLDAPGSDPLANDSKLGSQSPHTTNDVSNFSSGNVSGSEGGDGSGADSGNTTRNASTVTTDGANSGDDTSTLRSIKDTGLAGIIGIDTTSSTKPTPTPPPQPHSNENDDLNSETNTIRGSNAGRLPSNSTDVNTTRSGISSHDANQFHNNTSSLTFDYPVVLEFFQFKQQFHDLISNVVMSTQALTVQDPDVFKGMKDEDPLFYNRDVLKIPTEKAAMLLSNILSHQTPRSKDDDVISLNPDTLMSTILVDGTKFFESILNIIQQLIDERETILNYATRVMHDDFNVQLLLIERNNTISSEKSEDGHSYFTGKKQSNDVPWYLEGDEEYDLLLDVKGNIKGGTKEALVAHLTHHDLFDSNFNTAFILTFATIMKISEFINLLIDRFNIEAPEGLSYEEYNLWISKKQNPIRLRVMNIMKLLVEKHWCNSYYNKTVLKKWLKFSQSAPVQSFSIGKVLAGNLNKLLSGEVVCRDREPSVPDFRPPAPLTKGFSLKKVKLLDIDYIELARQLTLREFKLYSKITKLACISKVWGKKSGLNENIEAITNFIRASNQLTNYVAYMILRKPDPKKRVQIIRYFVQVAEKCRQYNNFSSMTAIISALYSSPIHRLKKTWGFVSSETSSHLQNMNKLMNSSRNFNEYRDVLKFVGSEPCVPFFGVYLSDLTFVYHGNPDHLLNKPRMINFAKRAKTCEIVLGIDRFKSMGYNLQEVTDVQRYLDSWFDKCPTIEEQYQISLQLEPREQPQSHDPAHLVNVPGNNFRNAKSSLGPFSFK